MSKNYLLILLFSTAFISACIDNTVVPTPSNPNVSSIPIASSEPVNPFDIIKDKYYLIQFGPGSKGVSNLGPGSKGVSNLGPGTKGVSNLKFNVNFDNSVVRTDAAFSTKATQPLSIDNLLLTLEKDNELIANINVLPSSERLEFTIDTNIPAGIYNLKATVKNNSEPLNVLSQVELKSNLEVKVVLYAKDMNRENLDISIRTKSIPAQE